MAAKGSEIARIQSIAARNRQESWFLCLPFELRCKIYSYLIPTRIHVSIKPNAWHQRLPLDITLAKLDSLDTFPSRCTIPHEIFAWIYVGYKLVPCTQPIWEYRTLLMVRPLMMTSRSILSDLSSAFFDIKFHSLLGEMTRACEIASNIPMLATLIRDIRLSGHRHNLGRGKDVRRLIAVVKSFPNLERLQVKVYRPKHADPARVAWEAYYEVVTIRKLLNNSGRLKEVYSSAESPGRRVATLVFAGAHERAEANLGTRIDLEEESRKQLDKLGLEMLPARAELVDRGWYKIQLDRS